MLTASWACLLFSVAPGRRVGRLGGGGTTRALCHTPGVKRVLLVLSQMPQDPASGAARSMRTMCEMLASFPDRFRVRGVVCTGTEHGSPEPAERVLASAGVAPVIEPASATRPRVLRFEHHRVPYAMLDTGPATAPHCNADVNRAFDDLIDAEARAFGPDMVLTFGGQPTEMARRARLRERGAAVVFGLRNHGYLKHGAFRDVDAVITPSRYLSGVYEKFCGLRSTALPVPINEAEVLAERREPVMFTFINPSPQKGLMFFARLAEELGKRRPDIGLMVVESRGTAGTLVRAGLAGGFDLRRHGGIVTSPGVAEPRHIYAATRVLLAPSVWEEPSGRVSGEAMLNGIPPMVSDRGGLPETVDGGGFVLPLPAHLTPQSLMPVTAPEVEPWASLIERLQDDEAFYQEWCGRARAAGERLRFGALAPRYAEVFESVSLGPKGTLGPGVAPR